MDYLKEPAAIYAKSFATIQQEVDFSSLPNDLAPIVERMIHACGMTDLIDDVAYSDDIVTAATQALSQGSSILTDCEMVRSGIIGSLLPNDNDITCHLNAPDVPVLASRMKTTRSAAQVSLWRREMAGSIILIGNAPTTLFALLEALDEGAEKPAAIIATPVGFVGAEEAKQALVDKARDVPFLTVKGRRGGSAIASAALNAVAKLASARVAA